MSYLDHIQTVTIDHRGKNYRIEIRPDLFSYRTLVIVTDEAGLYSTHDFADDSYKKLPLQQFIEYHINKVKSLPDYQHEGPTNEELDKYPALKQAWREFIMIRRITTGK